MASFIWYELMTDDADAAAAFYGSVTGWTIVASDPPSPMDYRMIRRQDGGTTGGVLPLTADMKQHGARPAWVPYLAVADVDAAVAAIVADGGKALMPRTDIAEGSFAMVTDPFGTPFYLMKPTPAPGATPSTAFTPDQPGTARWNELASPDRDGAKAFYAKHFGFAFDRSMPMGAIGDYCFMERDGVTYGAIMQRQEDNGPPVWLTYFGVTDGLGAKDVIAAAGGTVLRGPNEIPGGEYSTIALDPHGAVFGVVGPKTA